MKNNESSKKFFIQDTRQKVGNCILLWAHDGCGYTTDLDKAWLVTADWKGRKTDVLWPEETLRALARPRVDFQTLPERVQLVQQGLLPA
jgi:hypothetical protein